MSEKCVQLEFTVEPYLNGVRVDSFLCRHLRNYSKFRIQRLIRAGCVRIECSTVDLSARVKAGQWVTVELLDPPDKLYAAESTFLEIVFEDPWLIVLNKPAGMVVHPVGPHQSRTVCNALQWHLDQNSICQGLLRPGIVHRLDRMTSGLLVVAKDHHSHRNLSIDFQNANVSKSYLAVVEGQLAGEGTIDLPIGQAVSANSVLMTTANDAAKPRAARTDYSVVRSNGVVSLVEARPLTGRNHQIRVHLAAIGHPIAGDQYYGPNGILKPRTDQAIRSPTRHALHASSLQFPHPMTRAAMCFKSGLPSDMLAMMGD